MTSPVVDMSWWWMASVLAAVAISALVPLAMLHANSQKEQKAKLTETPKKQEEVTCEKQKIRRERDGFHRGNIGGNEAEPDSIHKEPWIPKLEIKEWQQASTMAGCPWNFDGCEGLSEVLERIWRQPLSKELQTAFDALKPRVKNVQVARVSLSMPNAIHFAIIYTLITGAELFGGAPLEHAVGLDLGEESESEQEKDLASDGLRRRRGASTPTPRPLSTEGIVIPLPSLLPFFRIHDGFGILLTNKHLPVLLGCPSDSVDGSCYYIYPARGLEPYGNRDTIVKFARVDRLCAACADCDKESPTVIYIEKLGQQTEDDEPLMSFIADTVSSIAGQRLVPPSYMGGPSCFGTNGAGPKSGSFA